MLPRLALLPLVFALAAPNPSNDIKPFAITIPSQDIYETHKMLSYSRVGPLTYESTHNDTNYGISNDWLSGAKDEWLNKFDWMKHQEYLNTFSHFTAQIQDDSIHRYSVHFVALYSRNATAVPLLFLHGWPGSFAEFLPILDLLKEKYTLDNLPYHVIVPSYPGYTFSSGPPTDLDFRLEDMARILDKLMVMLGFGSGYVVQGGDIGSKVARIMNVVHSSCKAVHINLCIMNPPENAASLPLNALDQEGLKRAATFELTGSAYATLQATRPSTIGFIVNSNPLALLAWIGEKFLEWTDVTPALDDIIQAVALYWFTNTMPRSLYPYRESFLPGNTSFHDQPEYHITKPFGFSSFPKEITPIPESWCATTGDLSFYRQHTKGGHFAAIEQPMVLLTDVEDFIKQVWPTIK